MAEINEFDNTELDAMTVCQMFTQSHFEEEDTDEDLTFGGDLNRAKEYAENLFKKQELSIMDYEMSSSVSCLTQDTHQSTEVESMTSPTSEAERNNINSAITPRYMQLLFETRVEYLMRVPYLIQCAINSFDLKKLKRLIDATFTENMAFKTNPVGIMKGRQLFYEHYVAILDIVPDFYLLNSKPKIEGRFIYCNHYSYGTSGNQTGLSIDKKSHLWNPFANKSIEDMDEKTRELKIKYDTILSKNMFVRFVHKTKCTLALNTERTHIVAFHLQDFSLELFEEKPLSYFNPSSHPL